MAKMNVSVLATRDCGKKPAFAKNRNKAKTKPIKANYLAPGPVLLRHASP